MIRFLRREFCFLKFGTEDDSSNISIGITGDMSRRGLPFRDVVVLSIALKTPTPDAEHV